LKKSDRLVALYHLFLNTLNLDKPKEIQKPRTQRIRKGHGEKISDRKRNCE